MIGQAISAGASLLGNVIGLFNNKAQYKRNMKDLNAVGTYQANPLASQQLALANNLYNGRMAGASAAENNIYQNQSNAASQIENNATDASQALALMAAISGQSDNAFADLAAREAEDRMRRAGLVFSAQDNMINEGDKVFNDKLRQLQQKIGIRGVKFDSDNNMIQGLGGSVSQFGNLYDNYMKNKKSNFGGSVG